MIPIQSITLHKVKMKLKHPFNTSFGTVQDKIFFIIETKNEAGQVGYGESVAFTSPWYTEETTKTTEHIITDFLIPILKKNQVKHPRDAHYLFSGIRRNNMAKAAIEMSLWDLLAKERNLSLASLLGGEKDHIDVGMSIGMQATTKDLILKIEEAIAEGFKRIKLKIAPGNDVQLLDAVRNAFPDLPLMADANSAYSLDDMDHLKQLDQFKLMMIEQPLDHDDIVDHARLQERIDTPICLDESIHSLKDVKRAYSLGSCKVINLKSGRVGGLTEAIKIHDFCVKNNLALWCGGMLEAGVGRAHNIALSALPGFNLPGDTAGSLHYWHEDLIQPNVVVQAGQIRVPKDSGIGFEINRTKLQKYTIKKESFHL